MADRFDWSLPGLNKHHFIAFANLLALQNGGQVEPASLGNKERDTGESDSLKAEHATDLPPFPFGSEFC